MCPNAHGGFRKYHKMLRQAARRRAAGAKSHSYSIERSEPWVEEGISRKTWYRRRPKQGRDTNSCPISFLNPAHETVSRESMARRDRGLPGTVLRVEDDAVNVSKKRTARRAGQLSVFAKYVSLLNVTPIADELGKSSLYSNSCQRELAYSRKKWRHRPND